MWLEPRHHLLSWVLSLETAKRHFKTTALVTDTAGAELLVEELGLRFDDVSTQLDGLAETAVDWWGLGKLLTYGSQNEPFIHIDSDVYLWSPLPDRLLTAPVLGQNSEVFVPGSSCYEPQALETTLADGGWLPEEWLGIRKFRSPTLAAVCCGIVGGTDIEFLAHYAAQASKLVNHDKNQCRLKQLRDCAEHMILIEQFFLWACLEYHSMSLSSKFHDVRIEYLFPSEKWAHQGIAVSAYTHLIGRAKYNQLIVNRLENRVRKQFPSLATRVDQLTASEGGYATRTINDKSASRGSLRPPLSGQLRIPSDPDGLALICRDERRPGPTKNACGLTPGSGKPVYMVDRIFRLLVHWTWLRSVRTTGPRAGVPR